MDMEWESLLKTARLKREKELDDFCNQKLKEAQQWIERYVQGECQYDDMPKLAQDFVDPVPTKIDPDGKIVKEHP